VRKIQCTFNVVFPFLAGNYEHKLRKAREMMLTRIIKDGKNKATFQPIPQHWTTGEWPSLSKSILGMGCIC